jgi:hypothetical protein
MQIVLKAVISLVIIFVATGIAKKFPSLAGLIAVMPLTGALVLVWVYLENKGNPVIMQGFIIAFFCFKKELTLPIVLCSSFGIWLAAAIVHQWILK